MTGTACGAGNAYPSGAPDFTSGFHRGSCCPVTCVSLVHVIVLSFVPLRAVTFSWLGDCVHSMTRIAMLAGVYTPVRVIQARQVEG